MRKGIITLILLTGLYIQAKAITRQVLFIGNSYTYTNNLPDMVAQLAAATGDTLIYDSYTPGGYTFELHSTDVACMAKINSRQWDIVVLQEQSQRPAFDPAQVATDTYPYAHTLDSLIRLNKPCTETMFFMTWGYKNGDASNCPFYPPICTYPGMQQRLRESYLQMAQDNNGIVAPVGAAWKQFRDSFSATDLYSPDNSHPSVNGTYLAACVFYASIFHKSPVKNTYLGGVATADAANMQQTAKRVVLDSLNQWTQYGNYTYAGFDYSIAGKTVTFANKSAFATGYLWDFGDMVTATTANPVHTYTQNNKYVVKLRASNTCFTEVRVDTVNIGTTGIGDYGSTEEAVQVHNYGQGRIMLDIPGSKYNHITVIDMAGRKLLSEEVKAGTVTLQLAEGIYIYLLTDDISKAVLKGKLSVH